MKFLFIIEIKGSPFAIKAMKANINVPEYANNNVVVMLPMIGEDILKPEVINSLEEILSTFSDISFNDDEISIATSMTAPVDEMKIIDITISERLRLVNPAYNKLSE